MSDETEPEDERALAVTEMCRILNETEPGPYTTRLVDISQPEGSQMIEIVSKTHPSVEDAVRAIRLRARWTKDMGVGAFLKPEVQAWVLNAEHKPIMRLVALEVQTVRTVVMFGIRIAGPFLHRAELDWMPITEDAGRKLLQLAMAQAERKSKGEG